MFWRLQKVRSLFIEQSNFETIYSSSSKLVIFDRDRDIWKLLNFTNRLDEGMMTQELKLIDSGVLNQLYCDLATAKEVKNNN